MATNHYPKTSLSVSLHACSEHHLSFGAASICYTLFQMGAGYKVKTTPGELAVVLNETESFVKDRMTQAKNLGFLSYSQEEGYGVTQDFIAAFVWEQEDVHTKARRCAEAFAHALSVYGKGRGVPTKETIKAVAKLMKDPAAKHLKPANFGLVVDWAAQSEYKDPKLHKFLRASTLLNGKFFSRVENSLEWRDRQNRDGLFANAQK